MLDFHVIIDLLPILASLFFQHRLLSASTDDSKAEPLHLNALQSAILLGIGLQRKTVEDIEVRLAMMQLLR